MDLTRSEGEAILDQLAETLTELEARRLLKWFHEYAGSQDVLIPVLKERLRDPVERFRETALAKRKQTTDTRNRGNGMITNADATVILDRLALTLTPEESLQIATWFDEFHGAPDIFISSFMTRWRTATKGKKKP